MQQPFELITGITPDVFSGLPFHGFCQFGKSFRLEHRVATAERHVRKLIGPDDLHDFLRRHQDSGPDVPRLRIMAAGTGIGTPGGIHRRTESRSVHRCVLNNLYD